MARSLIALEDYLVLRGLEARAPRSPGALPRPPVKNAPHDPDVPFDGAYCTVLAKSSVRTAPGLCAAVSGSAPITATSGGRAAIDLVDGLDQVCEQLHDAGREGPYALVVSMNIHRLLRMRTSDRDVPLQLLQGDVKHVIGMRALSPDTGLIIALGGQPVTVPQ